jgi:hypothetical protein
MDYRSESGDAMNEPFVEPGEDDLRGCQGIISGCALELFAVSVLVILAFLAWELFA